MFNPDQPIISADQDILGRSAFAKSLGDAVLSYQEKESISMGVLGAWGIGKTSIINMMVEHIENTEADKDLPSYPYKRLPFFSKNKTKKTVPIVVKFSPWNYSDQNQLISQFFIQLSGVLKLADHGKAAKEIGKKLETYSLFFIPLTLIPPVSPFALMFASIFKSVGNATRKWGEHRKTDLHTVRKELNNLLA